MAIDPTTGQQQEESAVDAGLKPTVTISSLSATLKAALASVFVVLGGMGVWVGGHYQATDTALIAGNAPAPSATTDTTNADNITSGTLSASRTPAYTGDVAKPVGSGATTIQPGAVTAGKMAVGAAVGNIGFTPANLSGPNSFPQPQTFDGGVLLKPAGATATVDLGARQAALGFLSTDFGAKCDGTTDDTIALQAFFNATAALRTKALITKGQTCNSKHLTIPSHFALTLNGTLFQIANNNGDFLSTEGTTDLYFDGTGTVDGNRANQAPQNSVYPGACMNMYGVTNLTVGGIKLTQCPKFPINVWNTSSNVTLRDTEFSYSGNSAEFVTCTNCYAYNLRSHHLDDYAFSFYQRCTHCGLIGGNFDYSAGGVSVLTDGGSANGMSEDVRIENVSATYNGAAGFIVWNNGGPANAQHTNIHFVNIHGDHNHLDPSNSGNQNYGGVWMNACLSCSVIDGTFHDDGSQPNEVSAGVYLADHVTRPTIIGNRIYNEGKGANALGVGISISADTYAPVVSDNSIWDDRSPKNTAFGLNGSCPTGSACKIMNNNIGSLLGPGDNITYGTDSLHYGNGSIGNRAFAAGLTYQGAAPTVSTGNVGSATFAPGSSDSAGTVTVTASQAVTATITFGAAFSRSPDCSVTGYGTSNLNLAGISPTVIQVNINTASGGSFAYRCSAP